MRKSIMQEGRGNTPVIWQIAALECLRSTGEFLFFKKKIAISAESFVHCKKLL